MFEATGFYYNATIETKEGKNGPYKIGTLLVAIDQSYKGKDGQEVIKEAIVPFKLLGAACDKLEGLQKGQPVTVKFELNAWHSEKNDKHYPELKGVFIDAKKTEVKDIPF